MGISLARVTIIIIVSWLLQLVGQSLVFGRIADERSTHVAQYLARAFSYFVLTASPTDYVSSAEECNVMPLKRFFIASKTVNTSSRKKYKSAAWETVHVGNVYSAANALSGRFIKSKEHLRERYQLAFRNSTVYVIDTLSKYRVNLNAKHAHLP